MSFCAAQHFICYAEDHHSLKALKPVADGIKDFIYLLVPLLGSLNLLPDGSRGA